MIDYRERQVRAKKKELMRLRLVKAKEERGRAKKAKEMLKTCETMVESMKVDLQIVMDNEICMKHRPTSVCVSGAEAAIEAAVHVLRRLRGGMLPTSEGDLKACVKAMKGAVIKAKKAVNQASDLADKVMMEKIMSLPELETALLENGCGLFWERLCMSGLGKEEGVTMLAPMDDAFLGDGMEGERTTLGRANGDRMSERR